MSKKNGSQYVYFSGSEETVIRTDETKKIAITKVIKRKKYKKITSVLLVIFFILFREL